MHFRSRKKSETVTLNQSVNEKSGRFKKKMVLRYKKVWEIQVLQQVFANTHQSLQLHL